MTGLLMTTALLLSQTVDADLGAALAKARTVERYAFKVETSLQGGENTSVATVEGRFEKDRPVWMKSGDVKVFRKGDLLAIQRNGEWRRFEGRDGEKRSRGQFTPAALRAFRLPHEELAGLAKQFKGIRKLDAKEGDQTVYVGEMTEEAARAFLDGNVDRRLGGEPAGAGRFWVTAAGEIAMIEIIVRVSGKKGRDSGASMWITLSEVGTAKAEVPEGAIKALEEK